jgi:uncharacterized membrane protein YbhN (UPF0104 family)
MNNSNPDAPSRPKKRWGGILQILISVAILAWLLHRVGLRDVLNQLATLNGWLYALAGLVLLASLAARAVRWYVLLTPLGVWTSLPELFYLYMIGFFWNSFLPSGFGGDVVKAIELRRISRQGAAAVTSVLAERIVGLLASSLIGLIAIAFRPRLFPLEAIVAVGGMCLAIIVGIWFIRLDILGWFDRRVPLLRPIARQRHLVSLHEAICAYDLRALLIGLLASIPFTFASILDSYLVGLALGIDLSIGYYAIYTPIISIIGLLPISFNGLGVREYTYQILFGLVGISAGQSIAMALAFNILRFGAGVLGGVVSVIGGIQRASDGTRTQRGRST